MEEILSQHEIDALVAASHKQARIEPDEPKQRITAYDFRRPNKFSKDELRALHRIHESFARDFSGMMSARLRSQVELKLTSLEQLSFGEFVRSLPNPSMISVFHISPLEGQLVVQLAPDIAFLLYDRMCGGPGRPIFTSRELTEIELAVMKTQFMETFSRAIESSWSEVEAISLDFQGFESNPQFLQIMNERETVLLINMVLRVNESEDMVNICLSHATLEPILPQIARSRITGASQKPDPAKLLALKKSVRGVNVPLEVELGHTTVGVSDLLELEVGDVIPLNTKKDAPLKLKVGSNTKFLVSPGRIGNRIGAVIQEVYSERDEDDGQ